MKTRIAIIQGHPDPAGGHLCHALADAYADGADGAGHEVAMINVAHLDFPLLRTREDWLADSTPEGLKSAQQQAAGRRPHGHPLPPVAGHHARLA